MYILKQSYVIVSCCAAVSVLFGISLSIFKQNYILIESSATDTANFTADRIENVLLTHLYIKKVYVGVKIMFDVLIRQQTLITKGDLQLMTFWCSGILLNFGFFNLQEI